MSLGTVSSVAIGVVMAMLGSAAHGQSTSRSTAERQPNAASEAGANKGNPTGSVQWDALDRKTINQSASSKKKIPEAMRRVPAEEGNSKPCHSAASDA